MSYSIKACTEVRTGKLFYALVSSDYSRAKDLTSGKDYKLGLFSVYTGSLKTEQVLKKERAALLYFISKDNLSNARKHYENVKMLEELVVNI